MRPFERQRELLCTIPGVAERTAEVIVAVAHSILVNAYHVLAEGCPYAELGGDYFLRREDQERVARRLVRQLERLGQRVTLEPVAGEVSGYF